MRQKIFCYLFILMSTATFATPTITQNGAYYNITGNTAQQLRAQMDTLGPLDHGKHVAAETTWHVDWHYKYYYTNAAQNPCYVTSVNVTGDVIFFMPEWTNMTSADAQLQNKWKHYLVNLVKHEYGHAENGERAANEIEKALWNAGAMPSCAALRTKLDSAAQAIIAEHNAWDVQYDANTEHGRTQGAVFP